METGHTPSRKHPNYWGGNIPWIGIRDATTNHGRTIYDTIQTTNEIGIVNSSARILPQNTVCLSRTASVGYVVVMGCPMATSQDFVNWVCTPDLDYRFLKYVLLSERSAVLRFASGTTHQTIYFPEVKAFHVCLPPLHEQRDIANMLGAFDDTIELNRRIDQTLEATVRALFKSWFVDFDPIRAKMGRHDTGLAGWITDLFPDRLVDSEIGRIPKGWNVGCVGDIASSVRRGVDPADLDVGTPYIGLDHMPRYSIALTEWGDQRDLPATRSAFRKGEILFGKLRPYFHKVGLAPVSGILFYRYPGFGLQGRDVVCVCSSRWSRQSISSTTRIRPRPARRCPRTSWATMSRYPLCLPPEHIVEAFQSAVAPMLDPK